MSFIFCNSDTGNIVDIVEDNHLLNLDPELKMSYDIYHQVRACINTKIFDLLNKTIYEPNKDISNYIKISIKTVKKYMDYVNNILKYNFSNGLIEGINNKIKVIKK